MAARRKLPLDPFLIALICAIALASVLPCYGAGALWLQRLTTVCIFVMFFLQGARLERHAVIDAMRAWELQGMVLLSTFALFPLIGIAVRAVAPTLIAPPLWDGLLFLCCLPSTVQSSIALTSIAGGNVAAAICAATISNIVGIIATPVLVGLVLHRHGLFSGHAIVDVALQLLLPFVLGQVLQPWVGPAARRHKALLSLTDRGSIVLVVYTAFSGAVVEGIWHRLSALALVGMAIVAAALLAAVLGLTTLACRLRGLSRADQIAVVLCGSKKSLASGVPMANVIFPPATVGVVVLPVMLYHQIQLFTCTMLARRWRREMEAQAVARDGVPARA
jgi:solute carrier family 10 (sodium/bile acid cotransporter), member 7